MVWRSGLSHGCQGCGCQDEQPEVWGFHGAAPAWGGRGWALMAVGAANGAQPGPGAAGPGAPLTCTESTRRAT